MQLTNLAQSKKLKAWGAPQPTHMNLSNYHKVMKMVMPTQYCWSDCGEGGDLKYLVTTNHGVQIKNQDWKLVSAYSLDKLIEWLGDDFQEMGKVKNLKYSKGLPWFASNESGIEGFGETLLEAVFNLCEAIHSKKGE